tara:strand:+ start:134838 stop:136046 length:1209 start_codon:yes stop_codon:yes gene_type:complete
MQGDDQSKSNQQDQVELSKQDQAVIDQIFESNPESFVAETDRDDAVLNVLNLLDSPVASELQRNARVDLIQILASRLESQSLELSPEDKRALDQYIELGYDSSKVDADLKARAIKCAHIDACLTSQDIGSSSDLIDRTLSKIQSHIDTDAASMVLDSGRRGVFSARWSDLVSIAAMLLIIGSIALPIMSSLRSGAQQEMCFENMHASANAFGLYAGSNRDMLPMATAGFGPTWMDVGSTPERSNSSNLFTLIRSGIADLDDLACPSNPDAATGEMKPGAWDWESLQEISYSYRIMPPGGMRATIAQPVNVVIMSDRSPVVLRIARRLPVIPEENSPNHDGAGQHMLMLDGSTQWSKSPIINGQDNIWLPRPIEQVIHNARTKLGILKGSELPDGPTDAFVGP